MSRRNAAAFASLAQRRADVRAEQLLFAVACGEEAVLDATAVHLDDAGVLGEMAAADVPLGAGGEARLTALQAGDTDPMQVVVEIRAGKSKRGWNYRSKVLERIHGEVLNGGLPGYLGHQKADDVATEFPEPVTHWIGAKIVGEVLYLRGVIDQQAGNLKRWIRAKAVTQTSIFGIPKLSRSANGEIEVVDYEPISNDWTPLKRAGMDTRIVYAGEMDRRLREGEFPQGEQNDPNPKGESIVENFEQLMDKLRQIGAGPKAVIKALGWEPKTVIGEMDVDLATAGPLIDKEGFEKTQAALKLVGELKEATGCDDESKLVEAVKALKKASDDGAESDFDKRRDKVLGEMVKNEKAHPLFQRLLHVEKTATEDDIKTAIGELLEDDFVKTQVATLGGFTKKSFSPAPAGETKSTNGATGSGTNNEDVTLPDGFELTTARVG